MTEAIAIGQLRKQLDTLWRSVGLSANGYVHALQELGHAGFDMGLFEENPLVPDKLIKQTIASVRGASDYQKIHEDLVESMALEDGHGFYMSLSATEMPKDVFKLLVADCLDSWFALSRLVALEYLNMFYDREEQIEILRSILSKFPRGSDFPRILGCLSELSPEDAKAAAISAIRDVAPPFLWMNSLRYLRQLDPVQYEVVRKDFHDRVSDRIRKDMVRFNV